MSMVRPLHLGIDGVGAKHGGAAVVLEAMVRAALCHPGVGRLTVFTSPRRLRQFDLVHDPRLTEDDRPEAEQGGLSRIAWLLGGLPARICHIGAEALICLGAGGGMAPSGVPTSLFVQQALPFSSEALSRCNPQMRLRMLLIRTILRYTSKFSARIVVQTPTMRTWLADALDVDATSIDVVMPGPPVLPDVDQNAAVVEMLSRVPSGRRLLYVGNDSPYKNVAMVVAAMGRVRQKLPGATLFLTWGGHGSGPEEVRVGHLLGAALRAAYQQADLLVMPSLVETVGLPMLEAMSVGLPVLAADRPYARDICADAAAYFDPLRPESFADEAVRLLSDHNARQELSRKGRELIGQRSRSGYDTVIQVALKAAESSQRRWVGD
jgi:glycosyltransferase involved in cell wall biosynthesis